ncbi:hypothetical protein ES703_111207 [subsurface metagenome]
MVDNFSSATITKIYNGYTLTINWYLSHETYYCKDEKTLQKQIEAYITKRLEK